MKPFNATDLLKKRKFLFVAANVLAIGAGAALIIFPPAQANMGLLTYLLTGIGLQIAGLLGWLLLAKGKKFPESPANVLFYFNLALAYFLEFPFSAGSVFFLIIPGSLLMAAALILSKKNIIRISVTTLVFLVTSTLFFSLNGTLLSAVPHVITQLLLFTAVILLIYRARQSVFYIEKENRWLKSHLAKAQKESKSLKQRLVVLQQGSENLSKDVKRREIEIQNILTLSEQMNLGKDSKDVLRSFLLTALGQMGSTHAFVMARESKSQNYWEIIVQKGLRSMHSEDVRMYLDGNFISLLRSVREPVYIKEMPKDNLFSDELDFLNRFAEDVICPIFVHTRLIGLVAFGPKISGRDFSKEDFNLISIVANQSAFVLDQVQKADDYRDQFSRTVRAMLYALEAKYMFTRGHLLRTTNYVTMTARRLGFSGNEVKQMSMGSILHDIGKTAVRDKYLLYDGSLSNTDKDLRVKERILTHAIEGGKILKAAGFSGTLVDMALHHHEYYNGQGFPDRLAGDEIPIQTRILAACNAYDAMTSDRPYRKALSKQVAMNVMEQQAGQQFDPEVVKAFLDVLKRTDTQPMYH